MQDKLKEMFDELTSFEFDIRVFIAKTLQTAYSHNWLKHGIPKALLEDWTKKRENDVKQGKIPEEHLINYADFSHYKDIILHNWKIFSPFFEDKEKLRVRLEDLNNFCRVITMHTRTLTEDELGMARVSMRWIKTKMEPASEEKKEGIAEVEDVHPIFRANPFMVEEGAKLIRGEKRPSEEDLRRIDLQLIDSAGVPLFAEIKWTGVDENQVGEYKRLIDENYKNYRLMWLIPDDLASESQQLQKLGAEVKVFSRKDMIELIQIRNAAMEVLIEIRNLLTKPFDYALLGEKITYEDVIRACYFDGLAEVDGKHKKIGLKQSAIGRYLDLVRSVVVSPFFNSLPELTVEFVRELLAASYSYKHGKFYSIARNGFASIGKIAHIHSSLSNIINDVWNLSNNFHTKYKNRIRALYGNDVRKYDLTYRVIEKIASEKGVMLDIKTLVDGIRNIFVMSPLQATPKVFHATLNQWIENTVNTSGYENDFAKRVIEVAVLKRILIPKRGITIMWVLAPRLVNGKLEADRVPCQSFIFNADHTLYLEAI